MSPRPREFKASARGALDDARLQSALAHIQAGFIAKRRQAIEAVGDFEALRRAGEAIRERALAGLDEHLLLFEESITAQRGTVHWARTAAEACEAVVEICRDAGAREIIKGKTMVGEEVGLNPALERAGIAVTETDLGEYILQLADEPPSHIIAPAIHKTRRDIAGLFRARHGETVPPDADPAALVADARRVLRERFLGADVGITGANFLVAREGAVVLVTNEGNGDLCATLPPVHVVVAGIEKVVPDLDDAATLLRLLCRSATGQPITSYTSVFAGARRDTDADGPRAMHVVLVDNGRTEILAGELREMLRCIRCGACLNHCPVYGAVGGHAYGWVYPGPMGAVLTPLALGLEEAGDLPNASSLCGRCEAVCPVNIPLPRLLRELRRRQVEAGLAPRAGRWSLGLWAFAARRPRLYAAVTRLAAGLLGRLGRRRGRLRRLPFARGWTAGRDLPAPEGETFQAAWRRRGGGP
ncbi:MAG: iron-sulfur cluster-binding protein [Gammaproteobacteria bacterium]|nr:iron-sulfur cluster-binding protein [Gammaproteobacteria bacterium]